MYLNKVAFSEMIWRKTINLSPDLVQCKIKRGHCVSAKNQKCWKNESTWVSQKRSCVKNTLATVAPTTSKFHYWNVICLVSLSQGLKDENILQGAKICNTFKSNPKVRTLGQTETMLYRGWI